MARESETSVTLEPSKFCKKCFYALDGTTAQYCPECGRWFHPDRAHTYYLKPRRPIYGPKPLTLLVCCLAVFAVVIGMGIHQAMYVPPAPPRPPASLMKLIGSSPFPTRPDPFIAIGCHFHGPNCRFSHRQECREYWSVPPTNPWSVKPIYRSVLPVQPAPEFKLVGFGATPPWHLSDSE